MTLPSSPTLHSVDETGEEVDIPNPHFNPNLFYTGFGLALLSVIPFTIYLFLDRNKKSKKEDQDNSN